MLLSGLSPWHFNSILNVVLRCFHAEILSKLVFNFGTFGTSYYSQTTLGVFNIDADSRLHDGTGQAAVPLLEKNENLQFFTHTFTLLS
jgi:hypothetical protein